MKINDALGLDFIPLEPNVMALLERLEAHPDFLELPPDEIVRRLVCRELEEDSPHLHIQVRGC